MSEERALPVVKPTAPSSPSGADQGPSAADQGPSGPGGGLPMDRRHALKVMALAAGGPALAAACSPPDPDADIEVPSPTSNPRAAGTAWDPDLVSPSVPWARTLSQTDLAALAVLCDVIIPADERSPSASAVGAQDFIDEWVSAP
ncbi:MAG: gluconate 2-dehydrogenase subunit 3 family protein, partial [Gemmatimonadetes bacterium]|nr:gluconate 2-dehydrogenase subunit 3 family protein [Gemmatimonadota bacterium]